MAPNGITCELQTKLFGGKSFCQRLFLTDYALGIRDNRLLVTYDDVYITEIATFCTDDTSSAKHDDLSDVVRSRLFATDDPSNITHNRLFITDDVSTTCMTSDITLCMLQMIILTPHIVVCLLQMLIIGMSPSALS